MAFLTHKQVFGCDATPFAIAGECDNPAHSETFTLSAENHRKLGIGTEERLCWECHVARDKPAEDPGEYRIKYLADRDGETTEESLP
jgi:hypothetical protein